MSGNLLKVWPQLHSWKEEIAGLSAPEALCAWSRTVLRRHISIDQLPFLSITDATQLLDHMERSFCARKNIRNIQEIRKAIQLER